MSEKSNDDIVRVYIPATFDMLVDLSQTGQITARSGWAFAVTDELRAFYTSGEEEEIELSAFTEAARTSLRLLQAGVEKFPHRRVVVSADVPATQAQPDSEAGDAVVKLSPATITMDALAAIHVDTEESEAATAAAIEAIDAADLGDEDAELIVGDSDDNYLAWYDPTELRFLVELS